MAQSWHNQVVALLPKSSGNLQAWVHHQDLIGNFLVNIKTMKLVKPQYMPQSLNNQVTALLWSEKLIVFDKTLINM